MSSGIDNFVEAAGEALKIAPDLYSDSLKPTAQESGKLLGRIPRVINAALAPLDIWILNREYNVEETKKLLANKLEFIDPAKIISPQPYVAVPALQAISYSMNSEDLRNLYSNLLAKAMNIDTKDFVHPSFVEIIKQLSPLEAKLLNLFHSSDSRPKPKYPIVKLRTQKSETEVEGADIVIHILSPVFGVDHKNLSQYIVAIDNLIRLNLINVSYDKHLVLEDLYEPLISCELIEMLKHEINKLPDIEYIKTNRGILSVTDIGQTFIDICIKNTV